MAIQLPANGTDSTTPTAPPMLAVDDVATMIRDYVAEQGQVTRDEIRTHLKTKGVPTDLYQKGFARIANQVKMLTEITRDDGSKVWEVKRQLRDFSFEDFVREVFEAHAPKKREEYKDHYALSGSFRLTVPMLSSRPVMGTPGVVSFERDGAGHLILFSGNYRAMMVQALATPGAPEGVATAVRFHSAWKTQYLDERLIEHRALPVPPSRPGQGGQGLTDAECLPAGTAVPFHVLVPGSHVPPDVMFLLLSIAGEYCGLSPAKAHLGWGRFTLQLDAPSYALVRAHLPSEDGPAAAD